MMKDVNPTYSPGPSFTYLQKTIHLSRNTEPGNTPLSVLLKRSQADRKRSMEDGAKGGLLVSDRDGVFIGCSLQVVDPFPSHICRGSWRWILRRILDALSNWFSLDLLPWQNGLPVFTSYCSLESMTMTRNTSIAGWVRDKVKPHPQLGKFQNSKAMSQQGTRNEKISSLFQSTGHFLLHLRT